MMVAMAGWMCGIIAEGRDMVLADIVVVPIAKATTTVVAMIVALATVAAIVVVLKPNVEVLKREE